MHMRCAWIRPKNLTERRDRREIGTSGSYYYLLLVSTCSVLEPCITSLKTLIQRGVQQRLIQSLASNQPRLSCSSMPPRSNKMAVDSAANDYELQRDQNIQANQQMLAELMGMQVKVSGGDALAISALGAPAPKRKKTVAKPKAKKEPKPKKEEEGEGDENVPAARPVLGTRRSARNAGKPLTSYAGDGDKIVDRMKMPVIVSQPGKRWDEDNSEDEDDRESGGARVNRLVGRKHDP